MAGLSEQPLVILMHDSQLGDSSLLEALHDLLDTGNVSGLFSTFEMDQIIAQVSESLGLATDERVCGNLCNQLVCMFMLCLAHAPQVSLNASDFACRNKLVKHS